MPNQMSVSAPGRICMFGEHQDYLGLPVVTAAINLRVRLSGGFSADDKVRIYQPDIGEYDVFTFQFPLSYSKERDYYKSAINVLQRGGLDLRQAVEVLVTGNIPINSGTSSSSALIVAWIAFLLKQAGDERADNPLLIAKLAHRAEVLEFEEPGGMMDHFATAFGGVQFIDFNDAGGPEKLRDDLGAFVLGDSMQPKDTKGILARVKNGALEGLRIVGKDIHDISIDDVKTFEGKLSETQYQVLCANIANRGITLTARGLMTGENFDRQKLGELLTEHHQHLRDGLRISTPKIERMIDAAMQAGALGAKINGSGGGGCMFAYAPEHAHNVAEAIQSQGGRAYIIHVDKGVAFESS